MTKKIESELTHATRAIRAVTTAIRKEVRLRLNEQSIYDADVWLERASSHSAKGLAKALKAVDSAPSADDKTQRIMLQASIRELIKAAGRLGEIC